MTQACLALALSCLALALCGAVPAWAQPTHIHPSLVAQKPGQPGETIQLAVLMQPDAGWHGYWINPGDAGVPLTLDWVLPPGAKAGALQFPVPETLLVSGLMNHVYAHDYAVLAPFTVPRGAVPGTTLPITAHAQWLACTADTCVPEKADLAGSVTVGSGAADPRFDAWRAALPATLDRSGVFAPNPHGLSVAIPFPAGTSLAAPHLFALGDGLIDYAAPQVFRRTGDWLVIDLARAKLPAPEQPQMFAGVLSLGPGQGGISFVARPGAVPPGGGPLGKAGFDVVTLLLAVAGAFAGGLVLNAMPCVFPILSLKAMALARGNSDHAHHEALAYSVGVVLACLALGGAMLGLRATGTAVGWAFQLQDPGVVAVLLLLAAAITANFAGLFELPSLSFGSRHPAANSVSGAFGTGLLAAFVATPCTGPFMAAAMGVALVLPVWAALAVFAALGLGLALPFLLLGYIPALRRRLPRPGAWMVHFRHAMAVPMGLTVLALAWLAWRLGGVAYAGAALVLAVGLVALLAWLGTRQRLAETPRWPLAAALALLVLAALGPARLASDHGAALDAGLLDARPFTAEALAQARAQGHPVFAYFTADWCLTCKVNEQLAIERATTRDAFRQAGVVVLVGDWTRRDPAITRFLSEQGVAGVPLYLWYPVKGAAQQLPQVLDPALLPKLTQARG